MLDSAFWVNGLPHTIEAFFAIQWPAELVGPPHYHLPPSQQLVSEVRRNYLREYGLSSADVPMLLFDAARSPPFSLMRVHGGSNDSSGTHESRALRMHNAFGSYCCR